MKRKAILIIVLLVSLVGCATQPISLTKQVQSKIDQVEGILTIPQSNLDVTVQATEGGGGGGLLGVLIAAAIDSARQSSAEKAAAPLLTPLREYDFRKVMLDASNDALMKIDKVKFVIPLRVEVVASESTKRIAFDQSKASALFFCDVNYQLKAGNLIVTASTEIYPKMDALKQFSEKPQEANPIDPGNVIYRKTFSSPSTL